MGGWPSQESCQNNTLDPSLHIQKRPSLIRGAPLLRVSQIKDPFPSSSSLGISYNSTPGKYLWARILAQSQSWFLHHLQYNFAASALTPRAIHLRPSPLTKLGKKTMSHFTKIHLEERRLPDKRNCHEKASKSFITPMGGVCTKHL